MDDNQKFTFLKYRWLIYSIYWGFTILVISYLYFDIRGNFFFPTGPLLVFYGLYAILFYKKIMITPANNFLLNPHYKYIKTNHPEIWKEIDPKQFYVVVLDSFYIYYRQIKFYLKWLPFLRGRYDDGKDPHLVNIRRDYSILFIIIHWNFILLGLSLFTTGS